MFCTYSRFCWIVRADQQPHVTLSNPRDRPRDLEHRKCDRMERRFGDTNGDSPLEEALAPFGVRDPVLVPAEKVPKKRRYAESDGGGAQ